eukprot:TRINITY_DN112542_c0_g1_i1.p1 TRINITY_DN112542_c0_g1~~TRINITY_DN112542_c0_g1_i1.p1  ORF type:complete len:464 (+),score=68.84 TRINITY_DN112542_c0_g1_i1:147-1538(+)
MDSNRPATLYCGDAAVLLVRICVPTLGLEQEVTLGGFPSAHDAAKALPAFTDWCGRWACSRGLSLGGSDPGEIAAQGGEGSPSVVDKGIQASTPEDDRLLLLRGNIRSGSMASYASHPQDDPHTPMQPGGACSEADIQSNWETKSHTSNCRLLMHSDSRELLLAGQDSQRDRRGGTSRRLDKTLWRFLGGRGDPTSEDEEALLAAEGEDFRRWQHLSVAEKRRDTILLQKELGSATGGSSASGTSSNFRSGAGLAWNPFGTIASIGRQSGVHNMCQTTAKALRGRENAIERGHGGRPGTDRSSRPSGDTAIGQGYNSRANVATRAGRHMEFMKSRSQTPPKKRSSSPFNGSCCPVPGTVVRGASSRDSSRELAQLQSANANLAMQQDNSGGSPTQVDSAPSARLPLLEILSQGLPKEEAQVSPKGLHDSSGRLRGGCSNAAGTNARSSLRGNGGAVLGKPHLL